MKCNLILYGYFGSKEQRNVRFTIFSDDKDAVVALCNSVGLIQSMYIQEDKKPSEDEPRF